MAENLKVSRYRNGDLIPNVTDKNKWSQLKTGAFSFYDNSIKNGTKYGNLYNWYAVDDKRCIAPKGWHVASDDECTLLKHYFTNSNVGNISKVDFIKHLGGKRNNQGTFGFINQDGSFWSSNEGGNNPIPLGIFQIPGDLWNSKPGSSSYAYAWSWSNCIDFTNKVNGLSIRCVKDTNQELSLKDKRIISAAKEVRERRKKMPIRFVIALIVSIVIIYVIGIIFYNSTSESMNRFFYIFGGVIIFGLFSKWIGNN